jgi:WD40 repeat protein
MPIATRTFRVFVSSTFEDLKAERNALQERVFPELAGRCAERNARFQAIDLRWGVREEAALDQKTMQICLAEIARCQRTGIKPNFIVLLGDRYGWRPLPARIGSDEFETLLRQMGADDRRLADEWYRLDLNAVPPEYLLKPREAQFRDSASWVPIETALGNALRNVAHAVGLPAKELVKYEASATHQEIVAGLGGTHEDRRHVFVFYREPAASRQSDLAKLLAQLRTDLPPGNLVAYSGNDSDDLCGKVTERLRTVIDAELARFQSRSTLEDETAAHDTFARERAARFIGRGKILEAVAGYLKGVDNRLLLIHGPSGSGKSSIVARVSETFPGVRRFVGTTPAASNGVSLLASLCDEMGRVYGQPGPTPAIFNELTLRFQNLIRQVIPARPLTLYIDALDQFDPADPASELTWLPTELPAGCRIVLSSIDVPQALASGLQISVTGLSIDEACRTLDIWFDGVKRTLQDDQRIKLAKCIESCRLPLYLKLVFEEVRLWKSFDPADQCVAGPDLPSIVRQLFARLSEPANHGSTLVNNALGLLTAARHGLTEDEMLALLAGNDEVWTEFVRKARHDLPQSMSGEAGRSRRKIPVVVWSRLYLDLEPYLSERVVPGGTTIGFYHRSLAEGFPTSVAHHLALARYYLMSGGTATQNATGYRRLYELPFQLTAASLFPELRDTLTDPFFIGAKCKADLTSDLIADFDRALRDVGGADSDEETRLAGLRRYVDALLGVLATGGDPSTVRVPAADRDAVRGTMTADGAPGIPLALKAWAHFVDTNTDRLTGGESPAQVAYNSTGSGPVANDFRTPGRIDMSSTPWFRRLNRTRLAAEPVLRRVMDCKSSTSFARGSLSATPDLNRAVSMGSRTIVWNPRTGQILRELPASCLVCLSANGRTAILRPDQFNNHTLEVWDVESWQLRGKLLGHTQPPNLVAITPDGEYAVSYAGHASTGEPDRGLRLWLVDSGRCLRVIDGPLKPITSLAISANGHFTLSRSDGQLILWDLQGGQKVREMSTPGDCGSIAASADMRVSACSLSDGGQSGGRLQVWDVAQGVLLHEVIYWSEIPGPVAMSPDGSICAVGLMQERAWIHFYDVASGTRLRTITDLYCGGFAEIVMSADCVEVLAATHRSQIFVYDLRGSDEVTDELIAGSFVAVVPKPGREGYLIETQVRSTESDDQRSGTGRALQEWGVPDAALSGSMGGSIGDLSGMAASSDGRYAARFGYNKVEIWDLDSGVMSASFSPPTRNYIGDSGVMLAFTPDGSRLLMDSYDLMHGRIYVWDLPAGPLRRTENAHSNKILSYCLTPDGRYMICGSRDQSVSVWDLDTLVCVRRWECSSEVNHVAVSPDGVTAVAWLYEKSELLGWNLLTGERMPPVQETRRGGHTSVLFSADGRNLRLEQSDVPHWRFSAHMISPDGRLVLRCKADTLWLGNFADTETIGTYKSYGGPIQSGAFIWPYLALRPERRVIELLQIENVPQGAAVVTPLRYWRFGSDIGSGSWDSSISAQCPLCHRRHDTPSSVIDRIQQKHRGPVLAWRNGTGQASVVAACEEEDLIGQCPHCAALIRYNAFVVDGAAREWQSLTPEPTEKPDMSRGETSRYEDLFRLEYQGSQIGLSIDGGCFASSNGQGKVNVRSTSDGGSTLTVDRNSKCVAISSGGRCLAVADGHMVVLFDGASGKERVVLQGHTQAVCALAFDGTGDLVASGGIGFGGPEPTIILWKASSGREMWRFDKGETTNHVLALAFSPDALYLASGDAMRTVKVWDVRSGILASTCVGHTGYVVSVAFSPDRRYLASGSDDKTVRIWETSTGHCLRVIKGHFGRVVGVSWGDGSYILTASDDSTIRMWETATGRLVGVLDGDSSDHNAAPAILSFGASAGIVVAGCTNGTIRAWRDVARGREPR